MFELLAERKPLHVMDLPQLTDEPAALPHWQAMVHRLRDFLEATLEVDIRDADLERELRATNRRNRLMDRFFAYAEYHPVLVSWGELYDVIALAQSLTAEELEPVLQRVLTTLERRRAAGLHHGTADSPRVLVTGCPVGGDSAKVLRIIEEAGGMVVALEACSGMKPFQLRIAEGTGDPLRAIAEAYLTIPCACISPNTRRFSALDHCIGRFHPDAVIDVTLQACRSFNIESHRVGQHMRERHGLPFLHLETGYSAHDFGQLRTRVEALLELINENLSIA